MAATETAVEVTPGTWQIDPSHTSVEFVARHLMVSKVRGRFTDVNGTVTIAENPLESHVEVEIGTASISTGDEKRDGHLKSADFFDVEQFPTISFRSTAVRPAAKGDFELDGDLTINGVTRPVTLDLEYAGEVSDPWGGTRIGFSASTEVNRKDWGLQWNVALETGGWLVSDKATINLEIEAVKL